MKRDIADAVPEVLSLYFIYIIQRVMIVFVAGKISNIFDSSTKCRNITIFC